MENKDLKSVVDEFDEDIEDLANKIDLVLNERGLTEVQYYYVRHKIMARLRDNIRLNEVDKLEE